MELTQEMKEIMDLIDNTQQSVFVTGKAGTGKTTFLKYLVHHSKKQLAVAASTGIAAINAGGATLHSLFGIPLGIQDPKAPMRGKLQAYKLRLFQRLEVLVIDEISMVGPDTIDYIDKKLRLARLTDRPFGGVQVVMFGDLYQLPPVFKKTDSDVLLQLYRGPFFFYAHVWMEEGFVVKELTHVFRQRDERFVQILNNIRQYHLYNRDMEDLDQMRSKREAMRFDNGHVHICGLRKQVESINAQMLGDATHTYEAIMDGDFKASHMPCDETLRLRLNARVMMLVNDRDGQYYNGSLGVVTDLQDDKISVELDDGPTVTVEPHEWTANEYALEEGKVVEKEIGKCTQFPISLAWAITIHKSQGLTFDKVTIHINYAFSPGMLYVALSRCTSLEGIISENFISQKMIIPEPQLIAFEKACAKFNGRFDRETYINMNLR